MSTRRAPSGTRALVRPIESCPGALSSDPTCEVLRHAENIGTGPGPRKCNSRPLLSVQCGDDLKNAREVLGWSQDRLARVWGCHRRTIMSYEAGDTRVPHDLVKWLEALAAEAKARTA